MGNTLARCTEKSCPVRFSTGSDRPCRDHDNGDDDIQRAAALLGIRANASSDHGDGEPQPSTM